MKYPHFFPVTRKCRVPSTRLLMEKTFLSRCLEENTAILEELIELRQKHAELLGKEYVSNVNTNNGPNSIFYVLIHFYAEV